MYLHRVYDRMVKQGYMEEYPEVVEVKPMYGFSKRYLDIQRSKVRTVEYVSGNPNDFQAGSEENAPNMEAFKLP